MCTINLLEETGVQYALAEIKPAVIKCTTATLHRTRIGGYCKIYSCYRCCYWKSNIPEKYSESGNRKFSTKPAAKGQVKQTDLFDTTGLGVLSCLNMQFRP